MLENIKVWLNYLKICFVRDFLLAFTCKQEWELVGKWQAISTDKSENFVEFYECTGCEHRCRKSVPMYKWNWIFLYARTLHLFYLWESFYCTLDELNEFMKNPQAETIKPCTKHKQVV